MTGQEAAEAHERLAHLDLDLDSAAKARRAAKAQQKRAEPASPLSGPSPIMSGPSPIMGGPMRGGGPAAKSRMSRMSAGGAGGGLFGRRQARKTSVSAPADAPEPDSGYWSNDSDSNPQGGGYAKPAHKPFVMQFRQYEGEEGVAPTHVLEDGKFEATPLPRGGSGAGGAAPVAHARFSKGGRGRRDAGSGGSRRASMSMPPPKQATVMLVDDEVDDDGEGAMLGGAGPFCGVDMGHFVRWLSCMPIIKENPGAAGEDEEDDEDVVVESAVVRRPAPSPGGLDDCASP